jgi:hypothetical protein
LFDKFSFLAYEDQKKTNLYWSVPKEFACFKAVEIDENDYTELSVETISLASTENQFNHDVALPEPQVVC